MSHTHVLVGCGDAKVEDESRLPIEAKELYTSNYFGLKRDVAEVVGDTWGIVSAEHGYVEPDTELDYYDTSIGNISDHRAFEIAEGVRLSLQVINPDCVIVLLGGTYKDRLHFHGAFDIDAEVVFPFEQYDFAGIGDQMSWLKSSAEEGALVEPDVA